MKYKIPFHKNIAKQAKELKKQGNLKDHIQKFKKRFFILAPIFYLLIIALFYFILKELFTLKIFLITSLILITFLILQYIWINYSYNKQL